MSVELQQRCRLGPPSAHSCSSQNRSFTALEVCRVRVLMSFFCLLLCLTRERIWGDRYSSRPTRARQRDEQQSHAHPYVASMDTRATSHYAPRLLIFGDSWASADYGDIDTWAELLSERCYGNSSINLAQAYCGSDGLEWQLKRLQMDLASSGHSATCEDDLAIVHVGGNDLYHATPGALAAIAASGGCCGLLLPPLALRLAENLRVLLEGLMRLGVRRIAVVGVPLTANVPMIARPASGVPGLVSCISCIMAGCNRVLLSAMHKALADAQAATRVDLDIAVVLNEARAIDEAHATAADAARLWHDVSHPSQALHSLLADAFQIQLANALPPRNLAYPACTKQQAAAAAAAEDPGGEEEEEDERGHLLARTPSQRAALQID